MLFSCLMGTRHISTGPRNRAACYLALAIVLAWSIMSWNVSAQASRQPTEGLVRQIDHIMICSDDPEKIMRLFSEKLLLPVVWAFQSYGTFSSGGVS
jgi:hypothetical protein